MDTRPTASGSMNDPTRELRILRESAVNMGGRQVIDEEVMDLFLAEHGVSWQTDSEVAGEQLAEMAGRIC